MTEALRQDKLLLIMKCISSVREGRSGVSERLWCGALRLPSTGVVQISPSKTLPKSESDRAVISVMKAASVSFEVLLTASGINLSGLEKHHNFLCLSHLNY